MLSDRLDRPPQLDLFAGASEASYGVHTAEISIPVCLLPGVDPRAPLAALIPIDREWRGRIEALSRFGLSWKGRRPPPDTRITDQQRRRLRLEIQAADGRASGASYRDIAIAMFGLARVLDEPWKTHPLKARVKGLAAGGLAKINGGYLKLLRYRYRY